MVARLILLKQGKNLIAHNTLAQEYLASIKEGTEIKADITIPRNLKQHKLLFSLLNVVFKAQHAYPTLEGMLDALKMATGHVREVKDLHGNVHFVPKSIDFASMDSADFKQWFDKAIEIITTTILPSCSNEALENEVYAMLGGPTPNDLRR